MTMETLRQKQVRFARLVPRLIEKAFSLGFEVTIGDVFRDPRVHGDVGVKMGYGHPRSCHKLKLAIDINLFRDGDYIQDDTGHRALGMWWKGQAPDCCWGGDFAFNDFNHYSIEHRGMR